MGSQHFVAKVGLESNVQQSFIALLLARSPQSVQEAIQSKLHGIQIAVRSPEED